MIDEKSGAHRFYAFYVMGTQQNFLFHPSWQIFFVSESFIPFWSSVTTGLGHMVFVRVAAGPSNQGVLAEQHTKDM